jgi:hypothetical protein
MGPVCSAAEIVSFSCAVFELIKRMQSEFRFNEPPDSGRVDGLNAWREERRRQIEELARQLRLPIGHPVELFLKSGICLRGVLDLDEVMLLHFRTEQSKACFRIGRATFYFSEIEHCVRTDT